MRRRKGILRLGHVLILCLVGVLSITGTAHAQLTFGNTTPFEGQANHSPDFVLGVEVDIPVFMEVTSFGMIYGHEDSGTPTVSNAVFALYSSGKDGLPSTLVAVTNPISLSTQQTHASIPFTSSAMVFPGTYWMMGLYQSQANPRYGTKDSESFVAYWDNPFEDGAPETAPEDIKTYKGQNFNYWINGSLGDGIFEDRFESTPPKAQDSIVFRDTHRMAISLQAPGQISYNQAR